MALAGPLSDQLSPALAEVAEKPAAQPEAPKAGEAKFPWNNPFGQTVPQGVPFFPTKAQLPGDAYRKSVTDFLKPLPEGQTVEQLQAEELAKLKSGQGSQTGQSYAAQFSGEPRAEEAPGMDPAPPLPGPGGGPDGLPGAAPLAQPQGEQFDQSQLLTGQAVSRTALGMVDVLGRLASRLPGGYGGPAPTAPPPSGAAPGGAGAGGSPAYRYSFGSPVAPGKRGAITVDWNRSSWVSVRDFGARGDGVSDDTAAFRAAAASGKNILVPFTNAHYKISGTVNLRSSIMGEGGGLAKIVWANQTGARDGSNIMFNVRDYAGPGMVIRGLHLQGGYNGGTGGEWGHNLRLQNAKNVAIEGNWLEDAYGDNILIGGEDGPAPSVNVAIRGNRLDNPRRCNVAVIAGIGVTITDNDIRKLNDYVSAIDLEPNPGWALERIEDLDITQNRFQVPNSIAVLLWQMDGGNAGTNIVIDQNTGRVMKAVTTHGAWQNVQAGNPVIANNGYVFPEGPWTIPTAPPPGSSTGVGTQLGNMFAFGGWAWERPPIDAIIQAGFKMFEIGYPDSATPEDYAKLRAAGVTPLAYINMSELHRDLKSQAGYTGAVIGHNDSWSMDIVDVTHPTWQDWLFRRAEFAYQRGARGIKWDCAEPPVPPGKTRAQVTQALGTVIQRLKQKYPDMIHVVNQGYSVAKAYPQLIAGAEHESLWSIGARGGGYAQWAEEERVKLDQLKQLGMFIIMADYLDPFSSQAQQYYNQIVQRGYIPYITSDRWTVRGRGYNINPGW